ncbi:MAG TPA: hypothetical protein VF756_18815 [Thermoanaerobaculia bacterium]
MRALGLGVFLLSLIACGVDEISRADPPPAALPRNPGFELRQKKAAYPACLPELPPGAEEALVAVQLAAEAGDLAALRPWLADDLNWSFGAEPGAAGALAHWREHPEELRELAAVLERGCLAEEDGPRVVCPVEYLTEPNFLGRRAGFVRTPAGWRMIFFVAGD